MMMKKKVSIKMIKALRMSQENQRKMITSRILIFKKRQKVKAII